MTDRMFHRKSDPILIPPPKLRSNNGNIGKSQLITPDTPPDDNDVSAILKCKLKQRANSKIQESK